MVDAFLPTLSAARKAGLALPDGEPAEQIMAAALIVDLRIVRREVWGEIQRLSGDERHRLDREPPSEVKVGGLYHVLGAEVDREGMFRRCRVDHYHDRPVTLNDVYTPQELTTVSSLSRLDAALDEVAVGAKIPEALRCHDLTPKAQGGAYRAASEAKVPDFHGYAFGSAFEDAKRAVEKVLVRGAVVQGEVVVYAWPLLWLRYDRAGRWAGDTRIREVVVFSNPEGGLHAYTGFPQQE